MIRIPSILWPCPHIRVPATESKHRHRHTPVQAHQQEAQGHTQTRAHTNARMHARTQTQMQASAHKNTPTNFKSPFLQRQCTAILQTKRGPYGCIAKCTSTTSEVKMSCSDQHEQEMGASPHTTERQHDISSDSVLCHSHRLGLNSSRRSAVPRQFSVVKCALMEKY